MSSRRVMNVMVWITFDQPPPAASSAASRLANACAHCCSKPSASVPSGATPTWPATTTRVAPAGTRATCE